MLHLLQCDAVRADYNRTTVYIINRINSSYAFLLKFLHNLGIVYNGPQGMDMPLAVIGTFLCHIYGPLYTETKTCVFSNKYFHKNNRYKTKTSGLGSWVLSLASIFSPPPPFSLQHLLSSYCPYLCVWHHLLFLTANDLSWNRVCPLPSPLQSLFQWSVS